MAIKTEALNVVGLYTDAFVSLTKKVTSLELEEVKECGELQEKCVFEIGTVGAFRSAMRCEMEKSLFEQLALGMNKNRELPWDTKVLYIIEYFNIVCGRVVSSINNTLKNVSRLTIPRYITDLETKTDEEVYSDEVILNFTTEYGSMSICLHYNQA